MVHRMKRQPGSPASPRIEVDPPPVTGTRNLSRREALGSVAALVAAPYGAPYGEPPLPRFLGASAAQSSLRITGMETFVVRVSDRTRWMFVRLSTNAGLTGLGEGRTSAAFERELPRFYELVSGESPFDIARYRQAGRAAARAGNTNTAAAFSALEHAQWDLVGKALGVPVYALLGGRLRDELPVYANINRATVDRTPSGFAENARAAVRQGFTAIKAAPFDGFPDLSAPASEVRSATELGISCVEAMREAIGPDVKLKIDCHSNFDVDLAVAVARRLEPQNLSWYEEPVAPTRVDDTKAIADAITQRMAGGEALFGIEEFAPLCQERAVGVIMPDVIFCGGILEGQRIATVADLHGVAVSPHNPSGPVQTAASIQLCAGMPNFDILEYQFGEADWRGDVIDPPESFARGVIQVPTGPGLGIELNERVVREHM